MAGGKPMRRRTMKRRGGCPKKGEGWNTQCEKMYKIMSEENGYGDCPRKGDNPDWDARDAATAANNDDGFGCRAEWKFEQNKIDKMDELLKDQPFSLGGIKRRMKRRSAKRAAKKSAKKSRRKGRKSRRKTQKRRK